MEKEFYIGVASATFAAFAFSLNFIAPFVIGDYSTFDFALVRHVVSGAVGLGILFMQRDLSQYLTFRNWLATTWLAFIGYVGYFLTVTGAAIYCGPVIAPWGTALALLATVGGVWAWTVAARNLPVALTAQLIVSETAFGVIGGLVVHARWPSVTEAAGIALLIAGVVLAIRAFHGQQGRPRGTLLQNS